jgi:hypothetical protein
MRQILQLPLLPNGTARSNIAGILPLSSLIEFIDVETKLHSYELSGRGIAWNWPITPVGARLILERCDPEKNKHSVCLLDGDERTPPLQCIDMRYADMYVSASRFTVRTCIEVAPLLHTVQYIESDPYRLQRLDIIHVYSDPPPSLWDGEPELPRVHHPTRSILTKFSTKWLAVLLIGWVVWAAAVVITIICACHLALSYLLMLPVTGLCVRSAFGHSARRLLVGELGKDGQYWRRSVIVANHCNETDWALFIGDSRLVNALLNKPLLRSSHTPQKYHTFNYKNFLEFFFRVLIAGQWGLILAASAQQGWDAIFISVAIILCSCTSSFIFRTSDSVSSWLTSNGVGVEKMSVTFTGRRAMLSAMIAVNPDRNAKNQWLDPILTASPSRTEWEVQVRKRLLDGVEPTGNQFLVECIQEGVQKASEINKWLLHREIYHGVPPRPEPQTPFVITPPKLP